MKKWPEREKRSLASRGPFPLSPYNEAPIFFGLSEGNVLRASAARPERVPRRGRLSNAELAEAASKSLEGS